jgi:hypothetical protein
LEWAGLGFRVSEWAILGFTRFGVLEWVALGFKVLDASNIRSEFRHEQYQGLVRVLGVASWPFWFKVQGSEFRVFRVQGFGFWPIGRKAWFRGGFQGLECCPVRVQGSGF